MTKPLIPGGYILLSRRILESGIMEKPPLYFKIWAWFLLKAQHRDYGNLKRGQLFTTIPEIQEEMTYKVGFRTEKPTYKQVWGVIEWLRTPSKPDESRFPYDGTMKEQRKEPMIETTKVTHGMVITIVKYDIYQVSKNYEGNNEGNNEGIMKEQRKGEQGNNNNKNDKNEQECNKNDKENISLQISNLRLRYSESQLKVIDEYFDILRWTRVHGKIADSVILKIYKEWEKFHKDVVIHSLQIYINNPRYHDKKEQYCYGIMRNAKAEDVYKGVRKNGEHKGHNGESEKRGGPSEESLRLERIAKEQGLIGADGSVGEIPEVDF